jgi:uncharacterized protein YggE
MYIKNKLMALTFLASLATCTHALAQNKSFDKNLDIIRTISVTGTGEEIVQNSLAHATLVVEANMNTSDAAQKDVAKRSSLIISFLRARNIDKLKTTSINLYPRYDYENNKQKLVGYTASNSISFEVAGEKLGGILDEVVKLGANRTEGVSFSASADVLARARNVAISKAVKDANMKADVALKTLGFQAKDVIRIRIDEASIAPPRPVQMAMFKAKAVEDQAQTPVEGGEDNVEAHVSLEIAY